MKSTEVALVGLCAYAYALTAVDGRVPVTLLEEGGRLSNNHYVIRYDSHHHFNAHKVAGGAGEATAGKLTFAGHRDTLMFAYGELTQDELVEVQDSSGVALIQHNMVYEAASSSPGSQSSAPWHLDRIDQRHLPFDDSYSWSVDGTGTSVFVLDSGVNVDLPAWGAADVNFLADCLENEYPCSATAGDATPDHGTEVAAFVNSPEFGVAKGAAVFDVRVLSDVQSTTSIITNGILTVMAHPHCQSGSGRRCVINMSLSSIIQPTDQALLDAIAAAYNASIAVVVAAGNQGTDACQRSPAQSTFAITVGATTEGDFIWDSSNYGECVDILAPGEDVETLNWAFGLPACGNCNTGLPLCETPEVEACVCAIMPSCCSDEWDEDCAAIVGNTPECFCDDWSSETILTQGTSFAAPQVAGALALIFEESPNLSVQGAYDRLIYTSTKNVVEYEDASRADTPNRLLYVGEIDCQNDDGCDDDLMCESGTCIECQNDGDCDGNLVCTANTCVAENPCSPPNPAWIGDAYCDTDTEYNNAACAWDGGDCCEESCVDAAFECGQAGFDCQDPEFAN